MPAVSHQVRLLLLLKMLLLVLLLKRRRERRQRRRLWMRTVSAARRHGFYRTAMLRKRQGDHGFFYKYFRMTPQLFDKLLSFVAADLTRLQLNSEPLEPGERLAITLSYLATGHDICHIARAYRVGLETARQCIHVTCQAIWARLKDRFMRTPTKDDWKKIADGFSTRWQFPYCLGAVDGRHVAITCPPMSGSDYVNYKGKYSIVLLAVVDSSCKYVLIDVGAEGRPSDGDMFRNSSFGKALINGNLGISSLGLLPGTATAVPHVFVGDRVFQLRKDFMRPFPTRYLKDEQNVFNYRVSRVRRCAENAFGLTAARWRILLRTINLLPTEVDLVVKAACVLHNFLTILNPQSDRYTDQEDGFGNVVAGPWRQGIEAAPGDDRVPQFFPLEATHSRNFDGEAARARNLFTAYFCSEVGEIPCQWHQPDVSKEVALKRLHKRPDLYAMK
ncbi:uncharacterized protein [Dermacentor albipictus]|uniref:uncharacterized protein isoform X1 n=1 Tax=Dermacentor albipictus TaxID=60249 RepID=UPI0031FCFADC